MTWERGRAEVEGLLSRGDVERVSSSVDLADRLLDEAERHLASAQRVAQEVPAGSYQLAYDAARKASAALLAAQGLRATSRGGHVAVQDVVRAQFGGPFDRFRTLRRRRHDSEYPSLATPTVTSEETEDAAIRAQEMLTAARDLVASGALDVFGRDDPFPRPTLAVGGCQQAVVASRRINVLVAPVAWGILTTASSRGQDAAVWEFGPRQFGSQRWNPHVEKGGSLSPAWAWNGSQDDPGTA